MECEREQLVVKEQLALLERTQKVEKYMRRMLWEQVEIFQGQMWVYINLRSGPTLAASEHSLLIIRGRRSRQNFILKAKQK